MESLEQLLQHAMHLLESSQSATSGLVAWRGSSWEQGRCLLEKVRSLRATQKALEHRRQQTQHSLAAAWEEAEASYLAHRQVARQALGKDFARQHALGLDLLPSRHLATWLVQASRFYACWREDPQVQQLLGQCALSQSHLEEGEALVQRAAELYAQQAHEERQAQQLARELMTALEALQVWLDRQSS